LLRRFESAAQGIGQVVAIAGEPGIGKSRLLFELRRRLRSDQARWVEGHCYSFAAVTPYFPMCQVIRDLCGLEEIDTSETAIAKLEAVADRAGVARGDMVPALAALLGVKGGAGEEAAVAPEIMKSQVFAAARALVIGLSRERPLVVLVEDLQWMDETSEGMLAGLGEGIGTGPRLRVVG